jgi:hypothetical protein
MLEVSEEGHRPTDLPPPSLWPFLMDPRPPIPCIPGTGQNPLIAFLPTHHDRKTVLNTQS